MIKPINSRNVHFYADINSRNPVSGEYKDPLMRWPLRGAAFTNEVGEALRPLIGKYATLTWAPALLYIGADVYDKYKNNQTEYSPNSKRCLKQACFQGLASILLPIFAVKGGQNLFSLLGMGAKDKVTINAKEQIIELAQQFVANGKLQAHKKDKDACIEEFLEIVNNNLDYRKQRTTKNPFKEGFYSAYKVNRKEKVNKFAEKIIKEAIDLRIKLLNPEKEFIESSIYSSFKNALKNGQTKNVAVNSTLNKELSNKTIRGRSIKTLGGFIALGIAIKPIDHFVENVLIGKVLGPGIDKVKRPTRT